MHNHAPDNYACPICLGIQGVENENTLLRQTDLVYKNEFVSVFINSFFVGNNPGHAIVVPNEHVENIYDLSPESAKEILKTAAIVARAMRSSYPTEGIMLLQNNEPASGQHAFHFHLHVFPRYENDQLHSHMDSKRLAEPEERRPYAEKLKRAIQQEIA